MDVEILPILIFLSMCFFILMIIKLKMKRLRTQQISPSPSSARFWRGDGFWPVRSNGDHEPELEGRMGKKSSLGRRKLLGLFLVLVVAVGLIVGQFWLAGIDRTVKYER